MAKSTLRIGLIQMISEKGAVADNLLDSPEVVQFLELTQGYPFTVLAGIIEENGPHKPYITQLIARNGQLLGHYRKRTIENEEVPLFSPGQSPFVFDQDGLKIGTAICADIDNETVFIDLDNQQISRL